jgi:hypothetical protein
MTLVFLSTRTAITLPPARPDDLLGGIAEIVGRQDRQAGLAHDLLAQLDVGALQPNDQRHVQADLARGGDDAFRDHVATHDAAEDVDQDAFDVRVRQDDLERRGDALARGAAADIEEVRRLAAIELDDVHGRHGKAGAVDHAADIAVELHVVEIVLRGFELGRILLALVAQFGKLLVPVERIVVEIDL